VDQPVLAAGHDNPAIVIYLVSGSVALMVDTIHNFSNALIAVPLWIAFVLIEDRIRILSARLSIGE